jgi:hypothetical protein
MIRNRRLPASFAATVTLFAWAATIGAAFAAPFNTATITKTENKVFVGERRGQQSQTRPASVADVLRAKNFLLSEAESRAELQYPDGSVVRVGQNTVFSFDAESRTLTLDRGALLFHIPRGAGGGMIKTPSLTAAITGTAGKVSRNYIAFITGEGKVIPTGQIVRAGEFVRRNADGTLTIGRFDPLTAREGKLVYFNGLMPGFEELKLVLPETLVSFPDLRSLELLHRANNLPNSVFRFFPGTGGNGGRKDNKEEFTLSPQTPQPPPEVPLE